MTRPLSRALMAGALLLLLPYPAVSVGIDDALQISLTTEKKTYAPKETIAFKVAITNSSKDPLEVLVRSYDWKDLVQMDEDFARLQRFGQRQKGNPNPAMARLLAQPNRADIIRTDAPPRPLGVLEPSRADGKKSNLKLNLDVAFCGTGLKKGGMPAGFQLEHTYKFSGVDFAASPGAYRFQWIAYRPQGVDKGRLELSKAVSNITEILIEK